MFNFVLVMVDGWRVFNMVGMYSFLKMYNQAYESFFLGDFFWEYIVFKETVLG